MPRLSDLADGVFAGRQCSSRLVMVTRSETRLMHLIDFCAQSPAVPKQSEIPTRPLPSLAINGGLRDKANNLNRPWHGLQI